MLKGLQKQKERGGKSRRGREERVKRVEKGEGEIG
jgi:hypothetical protein